MTQRPKPDSRDRAIDRMVRYEKIYSRTPKYRVLQDEYDDIEYAASNRERRLNNKIRRKYLDIRYW